MDLPTELSIFEILRRDIIAASELLGSAVGATSPHQMLMVRMCPLSPPPSHHHRIQMRPLMHLEHRKPANAALDDLLVVIVCVSSSTGDDVGGGGCHGRLVDFEWCLGGTVRTVVEHPILERHSVDFLQF